MVFRASSDYNAIPLLSRLNSDVIRAVDVVVVVDVIGAKSEPSTSAGASLDFNRK